ncbi:hypothetical protein QBC36DRAFT_369050 [Triangularia setosa]|uniref:Uncharacterized protein n=1 Tax=Triangularia setosa TaxID=2587417 RepID=A0AAN6VZG4_9PEZI|nr:hypothetical protein QBC36DRAFT_369050 [Podospora setosa]
MADIYTNEILTIGADQCSDCHGGLFGERKQRDIHAVELCRRGYSQNACCTSCPSKGLGNAPKRWLVNASLVAVSEQFSVFGRAFVNPIKNQTSEDTRWHVETNTRPIGSGN